MTKSTPTDPKSKGPLPALFALVLLSVTVFLVVLLPPIVLPTKQALPTLEATNLAVTVTNTIQNTNP